MKIPEPGSSSTAPHRWSSAWGRAWGVREARRLRTVGSAFLLAAVLLAAFGGVTPAATAPTDCELSFEPPEVRAGDEPIEVHWTATEELPEVDDVVAQQDSGLQVFLIDDRPGNLVVDASEATPGEWMLTLYSEEQAVCEGLFHVT